MNKAFRSTCDRTIQRFFEAAPLEATAAGASTALDQLPDFRPAGVKRAEAIIEEAVRELRRFENAALSSGELADLRLLDAYVSGYPQCIEELRLPERSAFFHLFPLAVALDGMQAMQDVSKKARAEALIARLSQLPGYLETARKRLGSGYDIPREWTEAACLVLDGLDIFFRETLTPFAAGCGALAEATGDAVEGSRRLLKAFSVHLREKLLPFCDGSFAVGRSHFEMVLEVYHGTPARALRLLEGLPQRLIAAEQELSEALLTLNRRSLIRALEDELITRTPALGKVEQAYEKKIQKALQQMDKRGIASPPDGEPVQVAPMPAYLWPLYTDCTIRRPPISGKHTPTFWVRGVDKAMEEPLRQALLQEHALPLVQARAATRGVPGALVAALSGGRSISKIRRLCAASGLIDGWGLYVGRHLVDAKIIKEPKAMVAMVLERYRAVIEHEVDVKLHLQLMSPAEAVTRIGDACGVQRPIAEATVRRIACDPSRATARVLGYEALLALRDAMKEHRGERYTDRELHDKVLAQGPIAPGQLKAAIVK